MRMIYVTRSGAPVAQALTAGMIASRESIGAARERRFEHLIRLFGPDIENRAHRPRCLHCGCVVDDSVSIGQRVAAPNSAQSMSVRRPPRSASRSTFSPPVLLGRFADGRQRRFMIRYAPHPLARPAPALRLQRFGERRDHESPARGHRFHPLEVLLFNPRRCVTMLRTSDRRRKKNKHLPRWRCGILARP